MKRQIGLLCLAIWMFPIATASAGDPYDPGRIYDPPRIYDSPGYSIPINQYVRVNVGRKWEYGTLGGMSRDSLVLRQKTPDGREFLLTFPRSSVHEIQVRAGTKGHEGWGILVGIIAGAIIGVAIGLEITEDTPPSDSGWSLNFDLPAEPFLGGLIGAGIGGGVGGAVGAAARTVEWRDVDLDLLGIGVIPRPRGQLALGFTVQF